MRGGKAGTVLAAVGVIFAMLGASFAAVPLYRLFCQVTGYGGTTQRAAAPTGLAADDRFVTVRFDASSAPDLGWEFQPAQREIRVRVGEETLAHYRARNRAAVPVTGTATFNVTPFKAGIYFNKVECFCFEEQRLEAGESVDMPVSFFVDPKLLDDPATRDVGTITLSYTMFRAKRETVAAVPRPN